jgi:hypothetical protein
MRCLQYAEVAELTWIGSAINSSIKVYANLQLLARPHLYITTGIPGLGATQYPQCRLEMSPSHMRSTITLMRLSTRRFHFLSRNSLHL